MSVFANAQDTPPTTDFYKLKTPNDPYFWYHTTDSTVWVYKGTYGWTRLGKYSDLDTLANYAITNVNYATDTLYITQGETVWKTEILAGEDSYVADSSYIKSHIRNDQDTVIGNEYNTSALFDKLTNIFSVTDNGGSVSDTIQLDADDIDDTYTTNKFTTQTDIDRLANTSNTNTGDQDLSGMRDSILTNLDSIAAIQGYVTTLEGDSHPPLSLTSDDTGILSLDAGTQAMTFVSSNIAKLDAANNFTNAGFNIFPAIQATNINLGINNWHTTVDGVQRFFFEGSSNTYLKTGDSFYFRNSGDANIFQIGSTGNVSTVGEYQIGGNSINTAGVLSNVAYLNQNQHFTGTNYIDQALFLASGDRVFTKFLWEGNNGGWATITSNVGVDEIYNATIIRNNTDYLGSSHGNTALASWELNLGGSYPNSDAFSISRDAPGTGVLSFTTLFKIDGSGNVNNTTGSYQLSGTSLLLDPLKSGSLGTAGQIAVGAGATSDFVWSDSINISGNITGNIITGDSVVSNHIQSFGNIDSDSSFYKQGVDIINSAIVLSKSDTIIDYAHGSCTRNNDIFISTVGSPSYIYKFPDPNDLSTYTSQAITGADIISSIVYDSSNDMLYACSSASSGNNLVIIEIDPDDISSYTLHDVGLTQAGSTFGSICTDGTYIYGTSYNLTNSYFFKITISTWGATSNTWTNGLSGHSCVLNSSRNEFYVTNLSASPNCYFAKVSTSDLSYSEVDISSFGSNFTDDIDYIDDGTTCLVFMGSESYDNSKPGGVIIETTNSNATHPLNILPTYGMFSVGNLVYSLGLNGYMQVFPMNDLESLGNTITYKLDGYMPNELLTVDNGRLFFTDWGLNKALLEIATPSDSRIYNQSSGTSSTPTLDEVLTAGNTSTQSMSLTNTQPITMTSTGAGSQIAFRSSAPSTKFLVGYNESLNTSFVSANTKLVFGVNAFTEKMALETTGQLRLHGYTSSSSFSGTPAGYLAFDSSGNVLTTSGTGGGSGTVTSVALSSSDLTVSGSPITTSGTFTVNLDDDAISNQTELTSGLASTDELMLSDAGILKRMDVSVLQSYMQSNLSFGGSGYWTRGTSILYPSTSSDRVLINKTTDSGSDYNLQIDGNIHMHQQSTILPPVTATDGVITVKSTTLFPSLYYSDANRNMNISAIYEAMDITGSPTSTSVDVRGSRSITCVDIANNLALTLNYLEDAAFGTIMVTHTSTTSYTLTLYGNTDGAGNDISAKSESGGNVTNLTTSGSSYYDILEWSYRSGILYFQYYTVH